MRARNGMVIGEFVCDRIEPLTEYELLYDGHYVEEKTRVSQKELLSYKGKNDFLYGWHISQLKIYDKPKELSEFRKPCPYTDGTHCLENKCEYYDDYSGKCCCRVERPPQSYMFVEELI